jgi:hypothetical protein
MCCTQEKTTKQKRGIRGHMSEQDATEPQQTGKRMTWDECKQIPFALYPDSRPPITSCPRFPFMYEEAQKRGEEVCGINCSVCHEYYENLDPKYKN